MLLSNKQQQLQEEEDDQHNDNNDNNVCTLKIGEVCICNVCEVTRAELLNKKKKKRRRIHSPEEIQNVSTSTPPSSRNGSSLSSVASDSAAAAIANNNNKRIRTVNQHDDNDDEDDDSNKKVAASSSSGEQRIATTIIAASGGLGPAGGSCGVEDDDDVVDGQLAGAVARAASASNKDDNNKTIMTKIQKMECACRTILECIGEDSQREGLLKTPLRWSKALLYLCDGYKYGDSPISVTNGALFSSENHKEMVVVRDIDIHSLCEHHMLPFVGRMHIGYIPNGTIVGLSKLVRIAEMYAKRLQVQERLTRQVANAIVETINPQGVGVVVECKHQCMIIRGVHNTNAITTTSAVRGCFETNSKTRAEFYSIINNNKSSSVSL